MKAKNRKEFVEVWNEEFNTLFLLTDSLKSEDALLFIAKVKLLRDEFVMKAADYAFPMAVKCLGGE